MFNENHILWDLMLNYSQNNNCKPSLKSQG